jgi:hypothetical protein
MKKGGWSGPRGFASSAFVVYFAAKFPSRSLPFKGRDRVRMGYDFTVMFPNSPS